MVTRRLYDHAAAVGVIREGDDGPNTLMGSGGVDVLVGKGGNDRLFGLDDIDLLIGGSGADYLSGGLGRDGAGYHTSTAAVIVDLDNPSLNTGDAAGDTYNSIESVIGTAFADILSGNASANELVSDEGNDELHGRAGNDLIGGGDGADILDGGTGRDVAEYFGGGGVVASLSNPSINTGEAAGDVYISIEDLGGTYYDDSLNGDDGINQIDGWFGNDNLKGYKGNDILTGGDGHDSFIFNTALNPATNVDTITDFDIFNDYIRLDDAIFNQAGPLGRLSISAFYSSTMGVAGDADDRIGYDAASGAVYYDADGNGAGAAVKFAVIANKAAMSYTDFIII